MTGKKITHTSDFDYENVIKRLKNAEKRQQWKPPAKPSPLRTIAPRQSAQPQPRPSFWARMGGALRDETKQLAVAGVVLLGFAGWMGSAVMSYLAQREEAQLADACRENNLAHAGASYCFDSRRFAHSLNADGSTKKLGIDWRVNESSLRTAEAAAAREAREAQESRRGGAQ